MSIAHVAHLYEGYWPVTYETATELLWATAGSGVVGTVFVGVFWGIRAGFGPTVGAAVAFVSAIGLQYGAAWLARRP